MFPQSTVFGREIDQKPNIRNIPQQLEYPPLILQLLP